ncbi:biotin--[acetyl-CoA-carboxylase] ligase [Texcoconibacillus texcoconensis]|uniref:Bifunctional ligase/repressor BirA n=1 Tax=Texcoconibacillus texcoconensis TaxID=1095777 RepID=A0A840QQG1_9BACI|nr:biotin--[acetyl-CoA-carboxylase] ligase [Texcoconibacillus texcoconensis]MBB5173578.1 BirA family biotin operon repressor/biotin-[acetyl-CoA-carboxylase] ligase [Texcoconibacillus texcoconensis]
MKAKLLQLLLTMSDSYISGQAISEQLGCSRTAIWKHIDALRKEGYKIEAVQNKGYRLVFTPNLLTDHSIQATLATERFGKKVIVRDEVTSTQELAHQFAQEGNEEGTIIVAEQQTAGKGRLGRKWYSPKGTGIWMSIILRPSLAIQEAPQLTLVAAVAVVRAIKNVTGIEASIKWPNDLLINDRKVAGILTEMQADPDRIQSIILGIGMNVLQEEVPEELEEIATSLWKEKGVQVDRTALLAEILKELEWFYDTFLQSGLQFIKPMWEAHARGMGERITARGVNETVTGTALGITDQGVLRILDDKGNEREVYSGDLDFFHTDR